jgi:hypothetical protein
MDRDEWPYLFLHLREQAGLDELNNCLCVMGGRGEYKLCLYLFGEEICYYDATRGESSVQIWESDQGSDCCECDLCNDRARVLAIVKYFWESGNLHPDITWRMPSAGCDTLFHAADQSVSKTKLPKSEARRFFTITHIAQDALELVEVGQPRHSSVWRLDG